MSIILKSLLVLLFLSGCTDDSTSPVSSDMGGGDVFTSDTEIDFGGTDTQVDLGDVAVPYFCDESGMVEAQRVDLPFELPPAILESPGPVTADFVISDADTLVFTVPADQKTTAFTAIWKPVEDDLVFYSVYNVAIASKALRIRYAILLDYQPVPAKITVWDRDRTQILDQYTGYMVEAGVIEPGESFIIDVEIDSSYLPEARTYDLIFAQYEDLQNTGHSVFLHKIVVFNGSFDIPAHPCFVKSSPLYEPTFVPTPEEAALVQAREDVNIQHLHIYADGHLLDSAPIAPHEVDVTGKTSVRVKVLGFPPTAYEQMGPWIAEVIFPILGDEVLSDRWNVAFPRINGGDGKPFIPVWRSEFDVPLPNMPSVDLQLLGTHTPYVPNVDPDGRPHIEAPNLWDQRSNVIRFVRTDAN